MLLAVSAWGGFRNGGFKDFKHSQRDRVLDAGVPGLHFVTRTYWGPRCSL